MRWSKFPGKLRDWAPHRTGTCICVYKCTKLILSKLTTNLNSAYSHCMTLSLRMLKSNDLRFASIDRGWLFVLIMHYEQRDFPSRWATRNPKPWTLLPWALDPSPLNPQPYSLAVTHNPVPHTLNDRFPLTPKLAPQKLSVDIVSGELPSVGETCIKPEILNHQP